MTLELANFIGIKIKDDNTWFLHKYYECGLIKVNFENRFIYSLREQTHFLQKHINLHRIFKISTKEDIREYLRLK